MGFTFDSYIGHKFYKISGKIVRREKMINGKGNSSTFVTVVNSCAIYDFCHVDDSIGGIAV